MRPRRRERAPQDLGLDPYTRALPLLFDPNTGSERSGWRAIVRHLEDQYALAPKRR